MLRRLGHQDFPAGSEAYATAILATVDYLAGTTDPDAAGEHRTDLGERAEASAGPHPSGLSVRSHLAARDGRTHRACRRGPRTGPKLPDSSLFPGHHDRRMGREGEREL